MIKFGPAGTGMNSLEGIKKIAELGLDAVEIEFTYGVRMSIDLAKKIGERAKKLKLDLSVHAPYYINLASEEREKITASMKRILDSCERAHYLGAKYVVFHPAFYGKRSREDVFEMVEFAVNKMHEAIEEQGWKKVKLAPETTGKPSQFGDLDELLRLKKETGCHLCVDFAHLKARNNGKIDYKEIFDKLKPVKHIHAHFSGIEFTAKGERRHLITTKQDLVPLLSEIKKRKADITIINESPDPVGDSLKAKKLFEKL
ncbi:TIM barrel protein [Candidatus Woesearchaeota archaeon]|nr:TIM barrel protein [Candidatus Woesearchaeota archaeon]